MIEYESSFLSTSLLFSLSLSCVMIDASPGTPPLDELRINYQEGG
jgi:hypothetical protein